jgi:hypothetical protein
MKSKFQKILIAGLLFMGLSCTKLDEGQYLYDKVTGDQFGKTDLELSSAVLIQTWRVLVVITIILLWVK